MSFFHYSLLDSSSNLDLVPTNNSQYKQNPSFSDKTSQPKPDPQSKPLEITKPTQTSTRENAWNFFSNPKSELEDRHKLINEEYRKEMHAKFQEKIIKDQKPKYIEKQEFYNSLKKPENLIENPQNSLSYNKSFVTNPSNDTSLLGPKEKVDYFSPQIVSKYQQNPIQTTDNIQNRPLQTVFRYSKTNMTSDQAQEIRQKQLEDWKKSVKEQLEERDRLKMDIRSKKIQEEKLEDVKVQKEIEELNKRYQNELRYEAGLPLEDKNDHQVQLKQDEKVKIPQSPKDPQNNYEPKQQKQGNFERSYQENKDYHMGLGSYSNLEPIQPFRKQPFRVTKDYQGRHENALQEAGIRELIKKIRSDAMTAVVERQEVIHELETIKNEIRNSRILDPFAYKSPYVQAYQPDYRSLQLAYAGKGIITNTWQSSELESSSMYLSKKPKSIFDNVDKHVNSYIKTGNNYVKTGNYAKKIGNSYDMGIGDEGRINGFENDVKREDNIFDKEDTNFDKDDKIFDKEDIGKDRVVEKIEEVEENQGNDEAVDRNHEKNENYEEDEVS
ncbi:hypothetical protein SteCoe_17645 [Stentor coeruleus]|uniref:Uncharacterized protein n=1 Tax=Stentor coeruleus TaxID=5963 RepID=A0A1R2BYE4_9CILI|nr:hypothetical protein SteCoe_17645 [Stentor coeruleus]